MDGHGVQPKAVRRIRSPHRVGPRGDQHEIQGNEDARVRLGGNLHGEGGCRVGHRRQDHGATDRQGLQGHQGIALQVLGSQIAAITPTQARLIGIVHRGGAEGVGARCQPGENLGVRKWQQVSIGPCEGNRGPQACRQTWRWSRPGWRSPR